MKRTASEAGLENGGLRHLTDREHAIERGGMYIGSSEPETGDAWCASLQEGALIIEKRAATFTQGTQLFRVFFISLQIGKRVLFCLEHI